MNVWAAMSVSDVSFSSAFHEMSLEIQGGLLFCLMLFFIQQQIKEDGITNGQNWSRG